MASSSKAIARSDRPSGSFADGVLTLEYDFLNTVLEATLRRPADRHLPQQAAECASAGRSHAAVHAGALGSARCRRSSPERGRCGANAEEVTAPRDTRTWHVFLRQSGAEVSGSILRIDGDTGTLVGHWRDGKLVLSHFAGERPNLFEATLNADGTLAVTLNGNAHYLVARTGEARAKGIPEPPDPSRYTSVKDPTTPFHFAFPDLDRTDGREYRRALSRQGRAADDRRQLVPELPRRGAVSRRALHGLPRARPRDRRPDVRERSGSESLAAARAVVHQALRRQVPDADRRHDATRRPRRRRSTRRCRSSSTSAPIRRRSCSAATAGSATCTPASRAPPPARSTCG